MGAPEQIITVIRSHDVKGPVGVPAGQYSCHEASRLSHAGWQLAESWRCDLVDGRGPVWCTWGAAGLLVAPIRLREAVEEFQLHAFLDQTQLAVGWRIAESGLEVPTQAVRSGWRKLLADRALWRSAIFTRPELPEDAFGRGASAVFSMLERLERFTYDDVLALLAEVGDESRALEQQPRRCVDLAVAGVGRRAADVLGMRETVMALRDTRFRDALMEGAIIGRGATAVDIKAAWDRAFEAASRVVQVCALGNIELPADDRAFSPCVEAWIRAFGGSEVTDLWRDHRLAGVRPRPALKD